MSAEPVNWGDVQGRRVTVGPIDATWRDLGTAAGTRRLGLRRIEIEPGRRSTPAHTHSGEEEIFYVLAGSGLSWQSGAAYEIEAGDCLVHLIEGPAHTLIAGPGGLDVLAFSERTASEACFLPRAQVSWLGSSWVKAGETPHPFAQEAAAGELDVPEPSARPATIVRTVDVSQQEVSHGECVNARRSLGAAAGAQRTALRQFVLAPGSLSTPPHGHSGAEELFVVLDGDGLYLDQPSGAHGWDPQEHTVTEGSIVAVPAGTGVTHTFRAGPDGLTLLAFGDRVGGDTIWYPRTQKVAFPGLGIVAKVERTGYWDGEE
jgi:uncharacterized cupin superfamily protein